MCAAVEDDLELTNNLFCCKYIVVSAKFINKWLLFPTIYRRAKVDQGFYVDIDKVVIKSPLISRALSSFEP